MLSGKTVLLAVAGGIAAYKIPNLASMLVKKHCNVQVLMTENACQFITPLTFETLTGNKCCVDTFDRNFEFKVEHVSLAEQADLVLVAPATANVIAKLAHGLADDMLTTTILACSCPKLIAPAMNTRMYENPVTQDNLDILRRYGLEVLEPATGYLACGTTGKGKMPEPIDLEEAILHAIVHEKDLAGTHLLVTAGPTRESIDPVRYLTNRSTGKMGYSIAKDAAARGAEVTLVTGPTELKHPSYMTIVEVESAADMFEAVTSRSAEQDIIIKAAAVADYRPVSVAEDKIKKADGDSSIPLTRTQDILGWLGKHRRPGQFLCGFSMETQNMLENSRRKLEKKNLDMICANNVKVSGAGFGVDTNVLTLITRQEEIELPMVTKDYAASLLLDVIVRLRAKNANRKDERTVD